MSKKLIDEDSATKVPPLIPTSQVFPLESETTDWLIFYETIVTKKSLVLEILKYPEGWYLPGFNEKLITKIPDSALDLKC